MRLLRSYAPSQRFTRGVGHQNSMQFTYARVLLEGQEVCTAKRVLVSAFKVVADDLVYPDGAESDFRIRVLDGERFPVIVYLGDGSEKIAGEAFAHSQTPSRLHIAIWRTYVLNSATGRWEV